MGLRIFRLIQWIERKIYLRCHKWGELGISPYIDPSCVFQNEQYVNIGAHVSIGKNSVISCYNSYAGVSLSPRLTLGDYFWARENLTVFCAGSIWIGSNVTIAGGVFITNENHGKSPKSSNYRENPLEIKEIKIGDGCWIGEKVCILPGAMIGEKCIIGAGSVVTGEIPPYSIAAGNPCVVKKRWNGKEWIPVNRVSVAEE